MKKQMISMSVTVALAAFIFSVLGVASSASAAPDDFKVRIAPSTGGDFRLVILGRDGSVKKQLGSNPDSKNLDLALHLGKKLERALNVGTIEWSEVTWELMRRLVAFPPENGYVDKSTVATFAKIRATDLVKYSVEVAPSLGDDFRLAIVGPEGVQTQLAYNPDSTNLDLVALNARKLEQALNSGAVKWKEITYHLLRRLVAEAPENGYVEASTIRAFDAIQKQVVKTYTADVMPSRGGDFRLVVVGPEGVEKQLAYDPDSSNLDLTVQSAHKIERALNAKRVKWVDIQGHLLGRFVADPPENGYFYPETSKAFSAIQSFTPGPLRCESLWFPN